MSTTSHPFWFRADCDAAEDPRLLWLADDGQYAACWLWFRGTAYAVRHLTDGYIPGGLPKQWGYRPRDWQALDNVGLWTPIADGPGMTGWLIAGFLDKQTSRERWERISNKRRAAARARWASR